MSQAELRFRQVHLDFHTSEAIAGIGARFDPDEFADTLAAAAVNSVTCFARGHHGWLYYRSEAFPERVHPHLERNLLADQIAACHARDIRVPIYITVQWDQFTAEAHPDWLVVGPDGTLGFGAAGSVYRPGFYRCLCLNSPFVEFLEAQTEEVLATLPTDGIFFDIVHWRDCSCTHCRGDMLAAGMDPSDTAQRIAFAKDVLRKFITSMTAFVRERSADCTIFYNSGHVGPAHRAILEGFSHLELESLPSGGWGYMHFPVSMRYARNLGVDCMGMTGKFHTSWGDFHSFKNPAALQFECFHMLALNAKCSIGDQLPPDGKICPHTYELIGSVYREVERREPWCRGATAVAEIGLMTPEEFTGESSARVALPAISAGRMLQELRHQFEIVDSQSDLGRFRLLILPDELPVSDELRATLDAFLAGGGSILASHRAGLNEDGTGFGLEALGVELVGDAPFSPDFLVPTDRIGSSLPPTEHVMYLRGLEVRPAAGTEVLADVKTPYFNRTWRHFCSHRHTPSAGKVGYPGIVRNGQTIYFAHPIFSQYQDNAPKWCKTLLADAIDLLLGEPLVRVDAPSSALAALNEQADRKRWVLHLLHYVPERRGGAFDVIEDVIPLSDVKVSLRADRPIAAARAVPDGNELPLQQADGRVNFTLPRLDGHQMIELKWA